MYIIFCKKRLINVTHWTFYHKHFLIIFYKMYLQAFSSSVSLFILMIQPLEFQIHQVLDMFQKTIP